MRLKPHYWLEIVLKIYTKISEDFSFLVLSRSVKFLFQVYPQLLFEFLLVNVFFLPLQSHLRRCHIYKFNTLTLKYFEWINNIDLHISKTLTLIFTMLREAYRRGCSENGERMSRNPDLSLPTGLPWLPGARVLRCFECWLTRRGVRRAINLSICQFNPPAGRNSEQKIHAQPTKEKMYRLLHQIYREEREREFHCALVHFISFDLISYLISWWFECEIKIFMGAKREERRWGENIFSLKSSTCVSTKEESCEKFRRSINLAKIFCSL